MKNEIPTWSDRGTAKVLRLAHLRRLKKCEQVAAVCYRMRRNEIEFLLVRTRGGRWTFPKGSAERGLTHAQAAALEAFEEAGVHGCMEEASFTRYVRKRPSDSTKSTYKEILTNAYLCEVRRLETPAEVNRDPTWFSPDKTKRKLADRRIGGEGTQLARVIDRAVARIEQTRHTVDQPRPLVGKVTFIDRFQPRGLLPVQSR